MLSSCTKYEEEIVPGNTAPPDPTVRSTIYEDYVNRSYILAMGREPSASELDTAVSGLKNTNLSAAGRETFATSVYSDIDYRNHVYEEHRFELLRSNDSADIALWIFLFVDYLDDSANIAGWPMATYQLNRLQLLADAKALFINNVIDIREVHRRMVNNFLYDQVNMGSQNFVLAVFQQLINRMPTEAELAAGIAMVDGNNAILFLQIGNSKDDFLDIVFNSNNYYEGQVIQLYEKYLLRAPDTQEMVSGTQLYHVTNDYVKVQKELIKTNEFIGLQ